VPRVHPTAVKVVRVLEALLKRHGGPPPPEAEKLVPARAPEEDVEEAPPE
jgi:hypothetical protein